METAASVVWNSAASVWNRAVCSWDEMPQGLSCAQGSFLEMLIPQPPSLLLSHVYLQLLPGPLLTHRASPPSLQPDISVAGSLPHPLPSLTPPLTDPALPRLTPPTPIGSRDSFWEDSGVAQGPSWLTAGVCLLGSSELA